MALQNIFKEEVDGQGELAFDYTIHTGDVSQNANRTFEYRDYYTYSRSATKNMCHVMTCGNNDLVEKKYSDAWAWYITAENQWANSVYAYDLGYTHFVCLNSNTDSTYVAENGETPIEGNYEKAGLYADTDKFLEAQADWLDHHLEQVNARGTKPRWIIVFMHLSPFTVSRAKRLQCFVPIFEKYEIPLVLCGHNHTNSRSIPLHTGYQKGMDYFDYQTTAGVVKTKVQVEETGMYSGGNTPMADEKLMHHQPNIKQGTHYVMINATGYKLSGKEKIVKLHNDLKQETYKPTEKDVDGNLIKHDNGLGQPWWYSNKVVHTTQPTYAMINITYNSITVTTKVIKGCLTADANKNTFIQPFGEQTIEEHDKLVINKSDRSQ